MIHLKHNHGSSAGYSTDLTPVQIILLNANLGGAFSKLRKFLRVLIEGRRASLGQSPEPYECVIDSRSVRSALRDSQKGVDGNKKTKGIKRHVSVDSNGYVPEVNTTTANIHDSKGSVRLIAGRKRSYLIRPSIIFTLFLAGTPYFSLILYVKFYRPHESVASSRHFLYPTTDV